MASEPNISSARNAGINDQVAVKLFLAVADGWGLSRVQSSAMAGVDEVHLDGWLQAVESDSRVQLADESRLRISILAGVYKELQKMFQSAEQMRKWLGRPNADFAGHSALERLASESPDEMESVRRYLAAWNQGPFV